MTEPSAPGFHAVAWPVARSIAASRLLETTFALANSPPANTELPGTIASTGPFGRGFHAVAVAGSVSRGAQRLRISQPAVSKQIRALEQSLGTRLFDRLAADPRLSLSRGEIDALVADGSAFVGAAGAQVRAVADRVAAVVALHPRAASYTPAPIL